jgi:predicted DNA-binding ribbon-helix-helix protein
MNSWDKTLLNHATSRLIAGILRKTTADAAVNAEGTKSIFERAMRHMVDTHRDSALVLRNVMVRGRRTTIRLEPEMWDALAEIARREEYTQTQLCTLIANGQPPGLSFTASVRMFILTYFRTAAHGVPIVLANDENTQDMAPKAANN